jgi:hypothetical protein
MRKWEWFEVGSRTRRRPIGRDYAAAKDAAFDKLRRGKVGKRNGFFLSFFLTGSTGWTGFFSRFPEETI